MCENNITSFGGGKTCTRVTQHNDCST